MRVSSLYSYHHQVPCYPTTPPLLTQRNVGVYFQSVTQAAHSLVALAPTNFLQLCGRVSGLVTCKRSIFGPKPWVNPLGKVSIFRLFGLLVFIAQKFVFLVLEYHQRHFPGLYCLKKKLEKWLFLDQNHGLTPQQKCQFFDFLDFLFLQPRKAFQRSRIS